MSNPSDDQTADDSTLISDMASLANGARFRGEGHLATTLEKAIARLTPRSLKAEQHENGKWRIYAWAPSAVDGQPTWCRLGQGNYVSREEAEQVMRAWS